MRILHLFDQAILYDYDYSLRSCAIVHGLHAFDFTTEQVIINLREPVRSSDDSSTADASKYFNGDINGDLAGDLVGQNHFLKISGIQFKTVNIFSLFSNIPILNYCREFFQLRSYIRGLIDRFKPQIIHSHSTAVIGLAAIQVGSAMNVPVVYEQRYSMEEHKDSRVKGGRLDQQLQQKLETYVIRSATTVVVPNEHLRLTAIVRGANESRIGLIENAGIVQTIKHSDDFSLTWIQRDNYKRELGLENKTLLGYVGSFEYHEGVHLLLQALPILLQGIPELHLLLVGNGSQEENLKQQAAEFGLSGQITFTGKVEEEKLDKYFNIFDMTIFPRLSTPVSEKITSMIPLLALANGQIVLASDVGGHTDVIKHGDNGFIFRKGDKNALADAVVEVLIEKPSWPYIRERGVSYIRNERNWNSSLANYKKLYADLAMHENA